MVKAHALLQYFFLAGLLWLSKIPHPIIIPGTLNFHREKNRDKHVFIVFIDKISIEK